MNTVWKYKTKDNLDKMIKIISNKNENQFIRFVNFGSLIETFVLLLAATLREVNENLKLLKLSYY